MVSSTALCVHFDTTRISTYMAVSPCFMRVPRPFPGCIYFSTAVGNSFSNFSVCIPLLRGVPAFSLQSMAPLSDQVHHCKINLSLKRYNCASVFSCFLNGCWTELQSPLPEGGCKALGNRKLIICKTGTPNWKMWWNENSESSVISF